VVSTPAVSVDALRAVLDPRAVLSALGISYRSRGHELYTRQCPACGQRNRETVEIHADEGMWRCYRCRAKGSILDLVAGYSSIDITRDFRRVVDRAAEIAGVDVTTAITPEQIAERKRKRDERRAEEEARAAEMQARMPQIWDECTTRSLSGEAYLRSRGFDTHRLRSVVRYYQGYAPALPLRDLETGAVVGIQRRTPIADADPKSPMVEGSRASGAALHGKPSDLDGDGVDVAVLVEGIADTIAACLAFPACAIYGAPGASQLGAIAAALAPRVKACRGWLVLAPHDDDVGAEGAAEAMHAAVRAGLTIADDDAGLDGASTLRLLGLPTKDLADAYSEGVRWLWPGRRIK
jgi:phage/plasmid primase-like uncharacterized protein